MLTPPFVKVAIQGKKMEISRRGKFGIFNPLNKWKKGDLPCDPTVILVLNEWGSIGEGLVRISASLATDGEIDFAIDQLIKDLECASKEAKRVLKIQRGKVKQP